MAKNKQIVSFSLSDESIKKLDEISQATGVSKSELVDMLIDKMNVDRAALDNIERLQSIVREKLMRELKPKA